MVVGASHPEQAPRARPGRLLSFGLPLAALTLVGIFALILFPYGRFRDLAAAQLSRATGAAVSLDDLDGGVSLGGPSLRATNLRFRWPEGEELLLEQARVRPAWSFSWLRGEPALRIQMRGPAGSLTGTVWPGLGPAFEGRARGVELSMLPLERLAGPPPATGRVDAEIDIRTGPTGPVGELSFEAWDGAIALPQMPFGIPYQEAQGELERGESGSLSVREFELTGPMIAATAEGTVAGGRRPQDAALDLEVDLLVVDPGLRGMVQSYGIRLDPEGAAHLSISGTTSRPILDQRP